MRWNDIHTHIHTNVHTLANEKVGEGIIVGRIENQMDCDTSQQSKPEPDELNWTKVKWV